MFVCIIPRRIFDPYLNAKKMTDLRKQISNARTVEELNNLLDAAPSLQDNARLEVQRILTGLRWYDADIVWMKAHALKVCYLYGV